MVSMSRSANNVYVGTVTGRGATPGGPNIRTNTWSLYIHKPTFAAEEAANFAVPVVTCVAERLVYVEDTVSRVFAVRYVPP